MASGDITKVRKALAKRPDMTGWTVAQRRAQAEKRPEGFVLPTGTKIEKVSAMGVEGEWVEGPGARPDAVFLYLHGGGYVVGSPASHRHLVAAISQAVEARVLSLDYRLAPEHPFPAAVEDGKAAYRWLVSQGYPPQRIVVGGDSAGGGLTVATLVALRDAGLRLPAAAVCLSPWVDLTGRAESYATHAARDPMVNREGIGWMAASYLKGASPKSPLASPLFANLDGLPPLLVQVGSDEILLDDARGLASRAQAAGVDGTLEVWQDMIHVWHWFHPMLQEGREAIARIGDFVKAQV